MRLVRDDEAMPLIEDHEDAVPADSAPKRRRRGVPAETPQDARERSEAPEPIDGAVEPSAAEDDAADESAPDIAIDLAKLEALLFSTHHPLTADDWPSCWTCRRRSPFVARCRN
jgi:hypothetical protein